MTKAPVLRRYAEALFAVASKHDKIDIVYENLRSVSSTFDENTNLEAILKAPVISLNEKKSIISDIFSDKIDAFTLNFLFLVIDKKRDFIIASIFEEFEKIVYDTKGISVAEVESAFQLNDELLTELRIALEKMSGKSVIISKNIVNNSIIGGIKVTLGDNVIDGSILKKIKQMRESLLNS